MVVEKASMKYLSGLTLDYTEDLMGEDSASTTQMRLRPVAADIPLLLRGKYS